MAALVHPLTGKPIRPAPPGLLVEVAAEKVTNKGGADQVAFRCPFCRRRNKQNVRRAIDLPEAAVAVFRCHCGRAVHVRKRAVAAARIKLDALR